jgi:hypothetical protein
MIQMGYFVSSSVNFQDMIHFNKLGEAYFGFWVSMTSDAMTYLLPSITLELLDHLISNCYSAMETVDGSIGAQAASIINKIYTEAINNNGQFYTTNPKHHQRKLLQLVMYRLLNHELEVQWSFTRPLLPLILYDSEWFVQYLKFLVSIQSEKNSKYEEVCIELI